MMVYFFIARDTGFVLYSGYILYMPLIGEEDVYGSKIRLSKDFSDIC